MSKNVRVSVPVESLSHLNEALTLRVWDQEVIKNDEGVITRIKFSKPGETWTRGEAYIDSKDKVVMDLDHMDSAVKSFQTEIASAYSAVKIMREIALMDNVSLDNETPFVMEQNQITVNAKVLA